jgi:phosphate transport system substrate-binding protein
MHFFRVVLCTVATGIFFAGAPVAQADRIAQIGGTGMGLEVTRLLVAAMNQGGTGVSANILPSLGSSGGIDALLEGVLDIALSARPLKKAETGKGAHDAACVRTPFVLASSLLTMTGLKSADVAALFGDPGAVWPNGVPLRIVLRSRDDSDNLFLTDNFPGMSAALHAARKRPDVPVAATDQDNAEFAQTIAGSLAVLSLLQIEAERLQLKPLALDGVPPTLDDLLAGTYTPAKTLCLVLPARPSEEALRIIAFARSAAGIRLFRAMGGGPGRRRELGSCRPSLRCVVSKRLFERWPWPSALWLQWRSQPVISPRPMSARATSVSTRRG